MTKKRTNTKLKQDNGQIHVVNLESYTRPEVIEKHNKDYVEYGEDNDYFQYLIDRYNGSPTNNAAINGISEMIYGKGIEAVENDDKPKEYEEMKSLFAKHTMKKYVMIIK